MGDDEADDAGEAGTPPEPWGEVARALNLPLFVVEDPGAGTLGWIAPSAAAMFGFPSAEAARGRSVRGTYDDARERVEAYTHFVAAIKAGKPPTIAFEAVRCRVDTGEPFPVLLRVHAELGPDQRPRRFLCMADDLSERRRGDQRFREGDARFKVLFDQSPVPTLLVHPDETVVRANRAAVRFFGMDDDALCGSAFASLTPEATPLGGPPLEPAREVPFRRGDGSVVWGAVAVSTEPERPDALAYHIVVIQDVDARRRMETELRQRERTNAVADLAAGIAHDFNNALAGLLGALDMAAGAGADGPWLGQARAGALRSRDLVRRIAMLAAGGSGVSEAVPLRALLSQLAGQVFGAGEAWTMQVPPTLVAQGDPLQLAEALRWMLERARAAGGARATPLVSAAELVVTAGSTHSVLPGRYVRLVIADAGPCPPPEELRKFFQPHVPGQAPGEGFALATAGTIIERHGGHLSVEPGASGGTRVVVLLPGHEAAPLQAGGAAPAPAATLRVLLMDDDELVREVTAALLKRLGHRVGEADSGEQALALARRALDEGAPYDVAILDLTVPGGWGGLQVVEPLSRLDPSLRSIVSSGYNDVPAMLNPRKYGFAGALPKPYDSAQLSAALVAARRPAMDAEPLE